MTDAQRDHVQTHFIRRSKNGKIGLMSATQRTQNGCPSDCPFMKTICYAENRGAGGRPSVFMQAEKYGVDYDTDYADLEARIVKESLPMLRWEVSGDVMIGDEIDTAYIAMTNRVAAARPDVTMIRYTHAWRRLAASEFHYTVNASCETERDVEQARAAGYEAVITVPEDSELLDGNHHWAGMRIVQCPNQTVGVECKDCKLCSKPRRTIVAFAAHGMRRKRIPIPVSGA